MELWTKYVPEGFAVKYVQKILSPYTVHITVSKPRKSKLGDYRHPFKGSFHKISVNGDLNPYYFLITLIHEIAHLIIWEQHRNRVMPHGVEWKRMYYALILPCIDERVFPADISNIIRGNEKRIRAGANSDELLVKILKRYDAVKSDVLYVEDLGISTKFQYKGRLFVIDKRLRKRYKCTEIGTNKQYLFSPVAEVKLVEN